MARIASIATLALLGGCALEQSEASDDGARILGNAHSGEQALAGAGPSYISLGPAAWAGGYLSHNPMRAWPIARVLYADLPLPLGATVEVVWFSCRGNGAVASRMFSVVTTRDGIDTILNQQDIAAMPLAYGTFGIPTPQATPLQSTEGVTLRLLADEMTECGSITVQYR